MFGSAFGGSSGLGGLRVGVVGGGLGVLGGFQASGVWVST